MTSGTNLVGVLADGGKILAGGLVALAAVFAMPGFLLFKGSSTLVAVGISVTAFVGGSYVVYRRSRQSASGSSPEAVHDADDL